MNLPTWSQNSVFSVQSNVSITTLVESVIKGPVRGFPFDSTLK